MAADRTCTAFECSVGTSLKYQQFPKVTRPCSPHASAADAAKRKALKRLAGRNENDRL